MQESDNIAEGTPEHDEYINDRSRELKQLVRKLLENFIKFLFASNFSGVIAVIAFLNLNGASFAFFQKVALTCFIVGILSASLLLIRLLIRIYSIDKIWHKNVTQWYGGKINWGELHNKDDALTTDDTLEFFLIITGFLSFVIGIMTIALSLWHL